MKPVTLPFPICHRGLPDPALPLTDEFASQLFTPDEIAKGEKRFEIKTRGTWGVVSSVHALAVEYSSDRTLLSKYAPDYCQTHAAIYGIRALSKAKQIGYELEGRVSIGGKSRRAFTSSMIFRLSDGRLLNCAILYVCN